MAGQTIPPSDRSVRLWLPEVRSRLKLLHLQDSDASLEAYERTLQCFKLILPLERKTGLSYKWKSRNRESGFGSRCPKQQFRIARQVYFNAYDGKVSGGNPGASRMVLQIFSQMLFFAGADY